jgi:hypothetical protein
LNDKAEEGLSLPEPLSSKVKETGDEDPPVRELEAELAAR